MPRDSIRVHPKHGLNPTMPVCFWCDKETGEIAFLGAAYKGRAPSRLILNYDPCDSCRAAMAQGITIIEARKRQPGETAHTLDKARTVVPTGRWVVVAEEAFRRIAVGPEGEAALRERRTLVDPETWKGIGLDALIDRATMAGMPDVKESG